MTVELISPKVLLKSVFFVYDSLNDVLEDSNFSLWESDGIRSRLLSLVTGK